MTVYRIPKLGYREVAGYLPVSSFRLRNRVDAQRFVIEGDAAGLQALAREFLLVAWSGGDQHLDPITATDPGYGYFERGVEVVLGDSRFTRPPALDSFLYAARPARSSQVAVMRQGSECWTHGNDIFGIDGNTASMLSFTEHCLDLAESETPAGTELTYAPGMQLLNESVPFSLRKLASTAK